MIVESSNPDIAAGVRRIGDLITAHGGVVAEDFIVREHNGHFSCAIATQPGVPARVLVSYPRGLTVPMQQIQWSSHPDLLEPVGGLDCLDPVQIALLNQWLDIINATNKVAAIRKALPMFAVGHWGLRHHLADAGFPGMREAVQPEKAKDIMVSWHSGSLGPATATTAHPEPDTAPTTEDGPATQRSPRFLIPLKHFVNHDPEGAPQLPIRNRTAVVTSQISGLDGTYEIYGELDALQLLVSFGYVDSRAPLVHSVPVEVESPDWGKVVVVWRAARGGDEVPDVPSVDVSDEGVRIHHLTARPGNRARIAALLGMVGQSARGMSVATARSSADDLLDQIAAANMAYYDRLDLLVLEAQRAAGASDASAPGILTDLAIVSLLQRERLLRMWG